MTIKRYGELHSQYAYLRVDTSRNITVETIMASFDHELFVLLTQREVEALIEQLQTWLDTSLKGRVG